MACIQLDAHIQQIRVFRARAMVAAGFALLLIGLLIARLTSQMGCYVELHALAM